MNIRRFAGKCLAAWYSIRGKLYPSFSQAGEDQLMRYLLYNCLHNTQPTNLDIGANHPRDCNNTYYFYLRGSKGVCIEPDLRFYRLIKNTRPRDVVLHAGIGTGDATEAALHQFPHPYSGWNTFSATEAEARAKETGIAYTIVQRIPLLNINDVMSEYFDGHPNILSIDVEGLDLQILQSLDFNRFRPEVICVESITFSMKHEEQKIGGIIDFLLSKGYFIFGDTHINTIFCRTDAYKTNH